MGVGRVIVGFGIFFFIFVLFVRVSILCFCSSCICLGVWNWGSCCVSFVFSIYKCFEGVGRGNLIYCFLVLGWYLFFIEE